MNYLAKSFTAASAACCLPLLASAQSTVVNIDFKGQRLGDVNTAGPFVGQGAAGGGTFFNQVLVDSTGGTDGDNMPNDGNTDILPVTARGLLDSNGAATTVSFNISPVGGDFEATNSVQPDALYDDYIFNNSAGNNVGAAGSPFTISGLQGPTADLYFYFSFGPATAGGTTVTGAAAGTLGTFNGFSNVLFFDDAPVSTGTINGIFGSSNTGILGGLTIDAAAIPEPASAAFALLGAAVLGLRRRRS